MASSPFLQRFFSFLSIEHVDHATAEGRSRERHRRIALTAIASAAAKATSMVAILITVPLTLAYLGNERYGMWMTITSLIAMLAFADLGVGNGLLSAVAQAYGRNDRAAIREYLSSGICVLTVIAVAMLGLFAVLYPLIPWQRVFNVETDAAAREAGPAMAALVICFALSIPLSAFTQVQKALQSGFITSLWQCVGSVLGLACVIVAIQAKASLAWLIVGISGAPLFATALNAVFFVRLLERDLRPHASWVRGTAIRSILGTGLVYLVLQVTAAVAFASDGIVIAQLLGPAAVTEYAVPEKLFSLIIVLAGMVLAPLWPAYGEASARGDVGWIRKTLYRSVFAGVIFSTALALPLVFFGSEIIGLWAQRQVSPPFLLLAGFGVWKIIETVGTAFAAFLNGMNLARLQLVLGILMAVSAITLKILLVQIMGIAGAVWALVASYLVFVFLPCLFLIPRLLQQRARSNS